MTLFISIITVAFDFSNDAFDFQNFASLSARGNPHVWLPCQAKEFLKMVCSVIEFSHYYVRLLLDVLCKLTTL